MLIKVIKIITLRFVPLAMAVALLLTDTPALAQSQPPAIEQPIIAAAPAAQASVIDLCADETTVTMPDGVVLDVWAFGENTGTGCLVQLPGPVLRVNQGDAVTVNLTNFLDDVPTSIIFPGQTGVTATGGAAGLFTQEAAAGGGTVTYEFNADAPGTYLYESGTADQPQTAMGLYGALVVDPTGFPGGGQAYTNGVTAYDQEAILVLSEIDPELNSAVSGGGSFDLFNYHPTYWLINGRAYPDTIAPDNPGSSQPYSSAINSGDRLLVRYINAGGIHHTMSLLDRHQRVIARDADELIGGRAFDAVAETIPSGHTTDVIIDPSGAALTSTFPLFNRQLHLTNGLPGAGHFVPGGGMMTFVTVTGLGGPIAQADLSVTKTDSPDPVMAGSNLTYNITVTNNGPDQADNVTLTDTLPGGVTLVSATPSQGSCDTSVVCNLGSIPFPGSATVAIVVTTSTAGSISNTASVASTTVDPDPANDSNTAGTTVDPASILYLSLDAGATVNSGALTVADEDILSFNGTSFAIFFDGSAADSDLAAEDIDGFAIVDADTILLSFDSTVPSGSLPGISGAFGIIDDSDIVQFDGTLGPAPVGTFSVFFDGSDVSLTLGAEILDGFELLSPTELVISTAGSPTPSGSGTPITPTPVDEDLLLCTGSFGSTTTCAWTMYYDGSDVGLGAAPPITADLLDSEDIDGAARAANGDIYLSVTGVESIPIVGGQLGFNASSGASTVSGFNEDIFICGSPLSTGPTTSCTFSSVLFFDGSAFGLGGNNVDAFDLP